MNRVRFILTFVVGLAGAVLSGHAQNISETQYRGPKTEAVRMYRGIPRNFKIYGWVVDQHGHGVSNAEVEVFWTRAEVLLGLLRDNLEQKATVYTDKDGRWELVVRKPLMGGVEVRREGYEYWSKNAHDILDKIWSKKDPLIVVMRKKGLGTYLIEKPSGDNSYGLISAGYPKSKTKGTDLLWDRYATVQVPAYTDLVAEVKYGVGDAGYLIRFYTVGENDGLILTTNLLFEAPAEGYVKEVVVDPSNEQVRRKSWGWYMYLRTRTPPIYSRLSIDFHLAPSDCSLEGHRVSVAYSVHINPWGDRNLEQDERLIGLFGMKERVEPEVRKALAEGRYPEKPDFEKLFEEVSAENAAEDAAYEAEWRAKMKADNNEHTGRKAE